MATFWSELKISIASSFVMNIHQTKWHHIPENRVLKNKDKREIKKFGSMHGLLTL
jgi:hypothetical protein